MWNNMLYILPTQKCQKSTLYRSRQHCRLRCGGGGLAWQGQQLLYSCTCFQPLPCHRSMDELIKQIHHYQTLPLSTNESSQSICCNNRWKISEIQLLFVQRLPNQEGHLDTLNKLHGPTIRPPLSSRRRRLMAWESRADHQGSITITIRQMCTHTQADLSVTLQVAQDRWCEAVYPVRRQSSKGQAIRRDQNICN